MHGAEFAVRLLTSGGLSSIVLDEWGVGYHIYHSFRVEK